MSAHGYQQLLRGPRFRWWRALLAVALAALFAFALGLALLIGASIVGMDEAMLAEEMTPASFLFVNLLLASLIPVSMLATRSAHGAAAVGALSSDTGAGPPCSLRTMMRDLAGSRAHDESVCPAARRHRSVRVTMR